MRRAAIAIPLLALLVLSGCAGTSNHNLADIYPGQVHTMDIFGTTFKNGDGQVLSLIEGGHVEGRMNETGDWGVNSTFLIAGGHVDGPVMTTPAPQGGGGDLVALPGANGTVEIEAHIADAAKLDGFYIGWTFIDRSAMMVEPASSGGSSASGTASVSAGASMSTSASASIEGNMTNGEVRVHFPPPTALLAPDAMFERRVGPGSYLVGAAVYSSNANGAQPIAFFNQTFETRVGIHWTATGEVEPFNPQGFVPVVPAGGPGPSRDEMVDKFQAMLPAGLTLTAKTSFAGTFPGPDGTDVDLGLYDPADTGVLCSASGGGTVGGVAPNVAPDPSQATEEIVPVPLTETGLWSVEVGAMGSCPITPDGAASSFFYVNDGPVPYSLEITVI
jgi:hypothetical protein